MKGFRILKIPVTLADIIDTLVKSGEYSTRIDYVKDVIRKDLRKRGLKEDA